MRVIIQRVKKAKVVVDQLVKGKIDLGYVLFVGFSQKDDMVVCEKLAKKVVDLRIFSDDDDKMNLSINDVGGSILSISQFTLYADCKKGRRPSFDKAKRAEEAKCLYEYFNKQLINLDQKVISGVFQADMKIDLVNDGPVTIILDSDEL
ncbi:MAG: D-aminoacyl-tRNA deacylase [Erysipelotrichaceae bacterium]|nr:D-aminoacyl-tRNA deacylase [Erysipelotrichaceae bacterium]